MYPGEQLPGYAALPSIAWIRRPTFGSALDTARYLRGGPGYAALPSRAPGYAALPAGLHADLLSLPWIHRATFDFERSPLDIPRYLRIFADLTSLPWIRRATFGTSWQCSLTRKARAASWKSRGNWGLVQSCTSRCEDERMRI